MRPRDCFYLRLPSFWYRCKQDGLKGVRHWPSIVQRQSLLNMKKRDIYTAETLVSLPFWTRNDPQGRFGSQCTAEGHLRQKSPVDVTQPSVSRILFFVVLCEKGRGPFIVDTFSEFRGSQMVVKVCAIVFYWTSGDRKWWCLLFSGRPVPRLSRFDCPRASPLFKSLGLALCKGRVHDQWRWPIKVVYPFTHSQHWPTSVWSSNKVIVHWSI